MTEQEEKTEIIEKKEKRTSKKQEELKSLVREVVREAQRSEYLDEEETRIFFEFLKAHKIDYTKFGRKINRTYQSINRYTRLNKLKREDARKYFKDIEFIF